MRNIFLPSATFIGVIGLWSLADALLGIKEVVLPNPLEILVSMWMNIGALLFHTGITMLEAVLGFFAGAVLGVMIAVVFAYSKAMRTAFYPYVIGIKATPVYALAPLLILWFGNGIWSKVVIAALVAFFPILVSGVNGFTSVEQNHLDLFNSMGASGWDIFFKLRLRTALPYLFPSFKVSTTFSVVGATIGEFAGASEGIGHLIVGASYYLETSLMFAGIVMISLAGLAFFALFAALEKRIVFWNWEL